MFVQNNFSISVKMKRSVGFSLILLIHLNLIFADVCEKSLTTASGPKSRTEYCTGELIFEDNFDEFDLNVWQHENSLWGGGVSSTLIFFLNLR